MNLYKEYIPVKHNADNCNFIKFTISFNKDTWHWATSQPKEKGYQLVATPVERGDRVEITTAFSGFYKIIYPVNRQSSKRLNEAIEMFRKDKEQYLTFFKNKGFELLEQ